MIEKRFCLCPQILWITLWARCATCIQAIDFPGLWLACPICLHRGVLNKIKDLATIRANPDSSAATRLAGAPQHEFWG
jgi:hypothetical protein